MEEKTSQEVTTRRRAMRMWLNKKRPCEIIRQLARSRKWFYKWLDRFKQFGWPGLKDQSRQPHTSSPSYPASARQLVVRLRRRAQQRKVGLIGARALRSEIKGQRLLPQVPSLTTINRWLKEADLLSSPSPTPEEVYYPHWHLPPGYVGHAMDWTARFLEGGEKAFAFHTLDLETHALAQTLSRDKAGESLHSHVLEAWQTIGLADFLQLDNDAAFNGGGKTPRRIGAFVRLCLFLGVELLFIPPAEPERNGEVERINGLWEESFWERDHFHSFIDLFRKRYRFMRWYKYEYYPPSLGGKSVAQAMRGQARTRLQARQVRAIPQELPITAGRIHFIRRVSESGEIKLLNETWKVSRSLAHQYVWATVVTQVHRLEIYHRRSERATPRLVKTFAYSLPEAVASLREEYRRHPRRVPVVSLL
jgi:hypothetical protein